MSKRYLLPFYQRPQPACWLLLGSIVSGGFVSASEQEKQFRAATEGYRYDFPRDHGAHEAFRTEWWYYTGRLAAKDGRQFGYQLTFFRRGVPSEQVKTLPSRWSITQLYLAHFAVTDLTKQHFRFAEKISRGALGKAGADTGGLRGWIDDWRIDSPAATPEQRLSAKNGDLAINLTLFPEKPPVVHGVGGVSRKGTEHAQASHYYSFTRLTTSGTVSVGNETIHVTGASWMDHEFGSADLGEGLVGWDWFSLQLDNGTELMLYRLRRGDGSAAPVSSGTFIERDGTARHLPLTSFVLEPTSFWTSETSRARYPQRWRLNISSLQISLDLIPLMAGQELTTSRSTQVTYWEGAISITGTVQGKPVQGQGYMELTGYAEQF